jgi:hypothetical protein
MLFGFSSTAGIYKWVDENGKVHYSDTEVHGAEEVELPKTVTFTPTNSTPSGAVSNGKADSAGALAYAKMVIVKPEMNETINSNEGNVDVGITLTPDLRPGHSITLYLDGKKLVKELKKVATTLTNIDRGSHTLRASVMDKEGIALINSKSVIFHLKRVVAEAKESSSDDNSEAFKPNFNQSESTDANYKKDFSNDYSNDFSKDYDSSNSYKEGAENYKQGVPSSGGTYSPGSSYTPNYNQK